MTAKFFLGLALVFVSASLGWFAAVCYYGNFQPSKAAPVAAVKLKFVKVDSEETNSANDGGEKAVDGNPNTYWHTQWSGDSPGLPHEIIIELDPPCVIKGFTCLPRQDASDHGTIKDYEFYVSNDGKNFGQPVKKGAFEPGKEEQIETFKPVKCGFIKLKVISEVNGLPWTSAAEIRVIQRDETLAAKDYWRGNSGRIPSQIPDCDFSSAQWSKDGQVVVCSVKAKTAGNKPVMVIAFDFSKNRPMMPPWMTGGGFQNVPEPEWEKQDAAIQKIIAAHGGFGDEEIDDNI